MLFVSDQGVWSDFLGMAKVTFSRDFQNGCILLYWPIFFRDLWLYASHQRAKKYVLTVYINTMWILGSYLHFWSVVTCHQGHKNRVKFIYALWAKGPGKLETMPVPSGSSRGSGKAGVGDASQFPGWLMKWQIQACRARCCQVSFRYV